MPTQCSEEPLPLHQLIYHNLHKIKELDESFYMHARENESTGMLADFQGRFTFFEGMKEGTFLYLQKLGWNVVFAFCGDDGSILSVYVFSAKLGYEIKEQDKNRIAILLNKHPGTGMFYGEILYISVADGDAGYRVYAVSDGRETNQEPVFRRKK